MIRTPSQGPPPPAGPRPRPAVDDGGRGARTNRPGRFETLGTEAIDDGWQIGGAPPFGAATDVTLERARTIINYVNSPYVGFDRSINPYRGCEHGCAYCFARPTHAYYGLSAGLDFERRIFVKPNAAALLARELAAASYKPRSIAIGTNTDPYQPQERRFRLMRAILQVLAEHRHPVSLLTKSGLIMRDIDLLAPMGREGLAKAMLSVTSLDPRLSRAMEPRASSPARRLAAIRALSNAGIPVGVMTAPMIPGLNDHELERLLGAAKDAGAAFAGYTIVRLPLEVAPIFREWLESALPDRAGRVMRHIREMNGGRDYDPEWSRAEAPRSPMARLVDDRFNAACSRLGLSTEIPTLDASRFRRPVRGGDQLCLFGESPSD